MEKDLKSTKAANNTLSYKNEQLLQQAAFLKDFHTQQISLFGNTSQQHSNAILYSNPMYKKSFLNVVDLPKAPRGHRYQLWANVNGEQRNIGILETTMECGNHLVDLPFFENCKGFSVSLEEEGGSQRSTSESESFLKGQMTNRY